MLSSNNPLRHNDFYDLWPLLGNAGVNISRLAAPSGCLVGRLRYILRPFSNYRLKTIGRPIIDASQQSSRDRHPGLTVALLLLSGPPTKSIAYLIQLAR